MTGFNSKMYSKSKISDLNLYDSNAAIKPMALIFEPQKSERDIKKYFYEKGFSVRQNMTKINFELFKGLSAQIVSNFDVLYDVIKMMRISIARKEPFGISMKDFSKEKREASLILFSELSSLGMINGYNYYPENETVVGRIPLVPNVIDFIAGRFQECYTFYACEKKVREMARRRDCDYGIMHNVVLSRQNGVDEKIIHELDTVFSLGDKIFWIEVKSMDKCSDYSKSYFVTKEIGLSQSRHMLLLGDTHKLSTAMMENLFGYYIADSKNFDGKLEFMINKAYSKNENN